MIVRAPYGIRLRRALSRSSTRARLRKLPASTARYVCLRVHSFVIAEFSREKYLGPWARVRRPKKISGDPKLGQELWTWLEEQVKDL
jgi:hypothetical protein